MIRNRIGYKHYDSNEEPQNEQEVQQTEQQRGQMMMTGSHADLCETINSLASLIVSKEFSNFSDKQKQSFVSQLINSSSLNAELTVKTMLLINA